MKPCVKCKAELPDSAGHCIYCGVGQPAAALQAKSTMMGHPGLGKELLQNGPGGAVPGPAAIAPTMVAPPDANQVIAQARQQQQIRQRGDSQPVHYGGAQPQGQQPYGAPPQGQQPYTNTPPQGQNPYQGAPPQGQYGAPPQGQYGAPPQGQPPYGNTPPHGQNPYQGAPPQGQYGAPPQGQYGAPPQGQPPYGNTPPHGQNPYQGAPPQGQQPYGAGPGGPAPFANLGLQNAQFGAAAQNQPFGKPGGASYREALTEQVKPLKPPPNTREAELWDEALTTQMLVFGVLLIACFVAPWAVGGKTTNFSWSIFGSEGASLSQKLLPILLAATGVVAVGLGALKLSRTSRAFAASAIGLAPILYFVMGQSPFAWQGPVGSLGSILIVSGLILRSRFPDQKMPRIMATVGVLAILAIYLIPTNGTMVIKSIFSVLADAEGKAKIPAIVGMGSARLLAGVIPLLLTVGALAVWLSGPGKAGSGKLAWTILFYGLFASIVSLLVGPAVIDTLKSGLSSILYLPLAQVAWMSLACFGIAGVLSTQLEND